MEYRRARYRECIKAVTILTPLRCRTLRVELGSRAQGFGTLYNWLSDRDVLIVKADRREPLDLAA